MDAFSIDINADVGEGIGNEGMLFPYITSCNIACGGHAGDVQSMNEIVALAKKNSIKIGAHPSFPDKANFGREVINISCEALYNSVKDQIKSLLSIVKAHHAQLHHVKPHGALYNLAAKDEITAQVILDVIKHFHRPIKLYVPYGSVIAKLAKAQGVAILYEAFADRNYNNDLSLVSRKLDNALITATSQVCTHVLNMVIHQKVSTINGNKVPIHAETICVHGDNPKAIDLVKSLRHFLNDHAIAIK